MKEDDLVKRLNEDFSVNAREDIQNQMKVYEAERKEAADRIEQLEAALHRISLGSQDSGTTKEALGREARAALGVE